MERNVDLVIFLKLCVGSYVGASEVEDRSNDLGFGGMGYMKESRDTTCLEMYV